MKILTREQQDTVLTKLVKIAIEADEFLKVVKDERIYDAYEEIVNQISDIAFIADGLRGIKLVAETEQKVRIRRKIKNAN